MMKVRAFDARMLMAQRQGKTSFYMQCLGEKAIACAFQKALSPGDMNFPTYRQQGLLISAGYPLVDMMNQIFSTEADPLNGRQLPRSDERRVGTECVSTCSSRCWQYPQNKITNHTKKQQARRH